jgi:hypothetical protein
MVFAETIIPAGKVLYKGYESRGVSCKTLLRDTKIFFMTDKKRTASSYGGLCSYSTKKTLRLFDLTDENVKLLLTSKYPLNSDTKTLLRVVLGSGVTRGFQKQAIYHLFGSPNAKNLPVRTVDPRPGERVSFKNLNKHVFGNLAREFLIPEKYDGYYAPKRKSIFHEGQFHSEIMLVNAYRRIERSGTPAKRPVASIYLPVVGKKSLKWAIPRIFAEFSKHTTRLIKPYGKMVIFCTGGMAIRAYMGSRGLHLPVKIRRTSDYDFTFALPNLVKSDSELAFYVSKMRKIMTNHMVAFLAYLNRQYKGADARLKISQFVRSPYNNPRMQVPGTKRRIYQVYSFQIVLGNGDVVDMADAALAVYPGSSRSMIHSTFSKKLGVPIQRLRYQLKDELAILSGSFLYSGLISHRNPITGKTKNKGAKDVARIKSLIKLVNENKKKYANLKNASEKTHPFLNAISKRKLKLAKERARSVEKVLKKIR